MAFRESLWNLTHELAKEVERKSPELLACSGIACFIGATIAAIKVTPEAHDILEEKKEELEVEELTVTDTVKSVGKMYIPTLGLSFAGICFTIASVGESNRRYFALSASYDLLKDAAITYKNKVIETVGKGKEQKIRESIAQDKVDANPPVIGVNATAEPNDGVHRQLYFEPISNKYFWETPARFDIAKANAFHQIGYDDTLSVYEWLKELPQNVLDGYPDGIAGKFMDLGWSIDDSYTVFDIHTRSSEIIDGEYRGYACLVIEYENEPSYDFKLKY